MRLPVVFLISHIPDPRMCRRMEALADDYETHVVYWDRDCAGRPLPSDMPSTIVPHRVSVRAPSGQRLKRLIPTLKFARHSITMLKIIKPVAIHCGNLDMMYIGHLYRRWIDPQAKLVYEVADLPAITFEHPASLGEKVARPLLIYLEKVMCKEAGALIITSPYFWDVYFRRFISKDKTIFMPNTPKESVFQSYSRVNHKGFVVGFVGKVRYEKQLMMLMDVIEDCPDASALIAGAGPALQAVEDYGASKQRIRITGPYDYRRDVVKLYQEIDCVYAVYDTSGHNERVALPNRLYEAIVCELPIICSSGTALAEVVEKHGLGYAVSADDPKELRKAIEIMSSDRSQLDDIRTRASGMKDSCYAEYWYDTLRKVYSDLLRNQSGV